jgi:hypothetical protein
MAREVKPISFKITQEEYDYLATLQQGEETSPSLVAKRMIREAAYQGLGKPIPKSNEELAAELRAIAQRVEKLEKKKTA